MSEQRQAWKVYASNKNRAGYGSCFPMTPPMDTKRDAETLMDEVKEKFGTRLLPLEVHPTQELEWD